MCTTEKERVDEDLLSRSSAAGLPTSPDRCHPTPVHASCARMADEHRCAGIFPSCVSAPFEHVDQSRRAWTRPQRSRLAGLVVLTLAGAAVCR